VDPSNRCEIDHFNKDGPFAWGWSGGNNVSRMTNASNGQSVELNRTGPGKITVADHGSLTLGVGHFLVGYQPGDSPSSSLIYYSGHLVER